MAPSLPNWSPVVFANDNPILLNDPSGLVPDTTWKTLKAVTVVAYRPHITNDPGLGVANYFRNLAGITPLKNAWPSAMQKELARQLMLPGYNRLPGAPPNGTISGEEYLQLLEQYAEDQNNLMLIAALLGLAPELLAVEGEALTGSELLQLTKILRVDKEADYEFYQPYALFLMMDDENGLLLSTINDGESISIESLLLTKLCNDFGIENCEAILNELKPEDELNGFVGQSIRSITVALYNHEEIYGDGFIIKQGTYAGVVFQTDKNMFSFFNDIGGHLWIDEIVDFPNNERWTMTKIGN